jgi:hypothetical protein
MANLTSIARNPRWPWLGRADTLCPDTSDIDLFRYGKGVVNLDAEVPHGTFNFSVSQRTRVIMHLLLTSDLLT